MLFDETELHAKPNQSVLVRRIIDVLREENAALASMDFARAGHLLPEKFGVADAIASAWRGNQGVAISYSVKHDLSCLIERNRTLVKAFTTAQIRALDRVTRAMKT